MGGSETFWGHLSFTHDVDANFTCGMYYHNILQPPFTQVMLKDSYYMSKVFIISNIYDI